MVSSALDSINSIAGRQLYKVEKVGTIESSRTRADFAIRPNYYVSRNARLPLILNRCPPVLRRDLLPQFRRINLRSPLIHRSVCVSHQD
jgi:hypothetical protein